MKITKVAHQNTSLIAAYNAESVLITEVNQSKGANSTHCRGTYLFTIDNKIRSDF